MLINFRSNVNFQDIKKTLSVEITHLNFAPAECRMHEKLFRLSQLPLAKASWLALQLPLTQKNSINRQGRGL